MDDALFQRMQEAAARFRSGESDYEEIMTPNGLARLVRDSSDPRGFTLDFVGDGARHAVPVQEYPPLPARPPGYPPPLPFMERCRATVNTLDQSVTWRDLAEPEKTLERLVRESLDEGWAEVEATRGPDASSSGGGESASARRVLEKDGVERTIELFSGEGVVQRLVLRERQLK